MYRKSNEPIWWSLFAAGGVIAALIIPALILVTGIIIPYVNSGMRQQVNYQTVIPLVSSVVGRIFLFVVISLPLFHWAHRLRYTLADLGVHGARTFIAVFCYGSAIMGALVAAWLVLTL